MVEVKGNGNIVSREVQVSSFIRLHLSGKGTIELHQGNEEKVIIETDENLQEYFEAVNSGRTLYVTAESKFRKPVFTACTIKVFLRQIDTLYVRNDKADVTCPAPLSFTLPLEVKIQSVGNTQLNIIAPSIRIVCQTVGNVTLLGKCDTIQIKTQMEGNFDSSGLDAGELTIKNMAEGNVELYASRSITIKHYGEGYVHYSGPAVLKDVKQYGQGLIQHTGAESKK